MATVENLKLAETVQEGIFVSQPPRANWLVLQIRRVPRTWWRYFLVLSAALLIFAAFLAAYFLRYQAQLFLSVDPAFLQALGVFWPLAFSPAAARLIHARSSVAWGRGFEPLHIAAP